MANSLVPTSASGQPVRHATTSLCHVPVTLVLRPLGDFNNVSHLSRGDRIFRGWKISWYSSRDASLDNFNTYSQRIDYNQGPYLRAVERCFASSSHGQILNPGRSFLEHWLMCCITSYQLFLLLIMLIHYSRNDGSLSYI